MSLDKSDFDGLAIDYQRIFARWTRFGGLIRASPYATFDVPLEIVVRGPGVVSPIQGRVFKTYHYDLGDGKFASYATALRAPGFKGTYRLDHVYVVEYWEDRGSDGHIEYFLDGLRFVKSRGEPNDIIRCECGAPHKLHRPAACLKLEK